MQVLRSRMLLLRRSKIFVALRRCFGITSARAGRASRRGARCAPRCGPPRRSCARPSRGPCAAPRSARGSSRRIRLPSFDGVRPTSDSRIAFSIALIEDLSYGVTVSRRASEAEIVRELLERRDRAVVVDLHAVEQVRRGAAGAHAAELVLGRLDGLVHALAGVVEQVLDDPPSIMSSPPSPRAGRTLSGRCSRSSSMLNTWIGSALSMHSDSAVESITREPPLDRLAVGDLGQELRVRRRCAGRRRRRPRRRSSPSGSPRRGSRARAAPRRCRW